MDSKHLKPFLSQEEITTLVNNLGLEISNAYRGEEIFALGVLKGSILFYADLVRAIKIPVEMGFIRVSSYSGTETTGQIQIEGSIQDSLENKNVLIVEDIVDTGITVQHLRENVETQNPRSIRVCALLDKKDRRRVESHVDFVGINVPDVFLVGYGMDLDNKFRNFPYISIIESET